MSEVILYAAIATIVFFMLYSVLGKSTEDGAETKFDPFEKMGDKPQPQKGVVAPIETDPNNPGLADIIAADSHFSSADFLDGAKQAYVIILEAFAEGDQATLKELLTPEVFNIYKDAIESRDAENLKQVTDLARLKSAEIVDAEKNGNKAIISVKFEAELASALLDAEGQAVQGDPELLAQVSEVWVFERMIKSKSENWYLSGVLPADGDNLEADPSPDTDI